ncbi:MAG: coproporphyrinogen dehydrogenase HemZ [Firmicutes bacterium]|nr:coproporphyrinogen dehydrogenase HemZ [Bacillota bacterium]
MYNIYLEENKLKYELNELVKMFLKPSEFQLVGPEAKAEAQVCVEGMDDKNEAKRFLFDQLSRLTGQTPDWGTLTGVRPVKLAMEQFRKGYDADQVRRILKETYYLSDEKIELLVNLCLLQREILKDCDPDAVGIYAGIPFCPTRCVYCSFTSNQVKYEKIPPYLRALHKEINFVGEHLRTIGRKAESIYIGGGTPTTLTAEDLRELIARIQSAVDMSGVREFTVEAGRPDTITEEKLRVIRDSGVGRISINPQSMKQRTLDLIGRSHTPEEIRSAFRKAKEMRIPIINADLITGLPEENPEDFRHTLEEIIQLDPENITVHTLAVKRASRLIEQDADYHYRQGEVVREMLFIASKLLTEAGYHPYYLYRQKHMSGNFENVGWSKPGTESIYNIRIMEEDQTIVAMGAGGISKMYYPEENRLERIPNVSNYEIYIDRIDEMIERKRKGIE